MNKTYLIALAAALMAAPLVMAHEPKGTPKNYCEPQSEWVVHDYAPPSTGHLILLNQDGNLFGDCNGTTGVEPGVLCVGVDPTSPETIINSFFIGLCESDIDPPVADFDGHSEFAHGGAWILAGSNAFDCYGEEAHHAEFGTAILDDYAGTLANFTIATDLNGITNGPCGDFEAEHTTNCVQAVAFCTVTDPAGIDGAYLVFVAGTAGHIIW